MPAYTLRPATDADFQFMCDTKLDGMRPYVEAVWGWDRAQQEQIVRRKFDPDRSRIVVVDGIDSGWIHVVEDDEAFFLRAIFLTAAARRRGVGAALVGDVIDRARRSGKPVALRVMKVNPARRLYERLGFRITGESETHFWMRWSPDSGGRAVVDP